MAFAKKTWKDRISEYPNRRTINDGYVTKSVTVGRDEGEVTEEGTPFNASNMNDLEARIEAACAGGGGGGASSLNDLSDVEITSATSGQVLKYDGAKWINGNGGGGVPWTDVTGTLVAGNTSITLLDASITTNSTIDVYTDTFGVNPTAMTVATGSVTLAFASQANDLGVKVRIS